MQIETDGNKWKKGDLITIEESTPIMKKWETYIVTDVSDTHITYEEIKVERGLYAWIMRPTTTNGRANRLLAVLLGCIAIGTIIVIGISYIW